MELGRVAGPYASSELPATHISRFGVIPKRNQPGKWRLIIDLSYPKGHSINDGISKPLCELHYVTIDEAIDKIVQLGNGSLLAKIDIQSAFRLLPYPPSRPSLTSNALEQQSLYRYLPTFWATVSPKII